MKIDIDWKHIASSLILLMILSGLGVVWDFQNIKAEVRIVKKQIKGQEERMHATDSVVKFLAWAKCKEAIEKKQDDIVQKCDKYLTEGINAKNI